MLKMKQLGIRMDPNKPRILITRLSHIGDCVLTLPLVNRLRDHFPKSFIAWAIESPSNKLLGNQSSVDQFIRVPKSWMTRPAHWKSLRREFLDFNFDIAIDPQGITKSAMLAWISGAKTRIGIQGEWGRELSPWLNNKLIKTTSTHLVDRSLELLSALDIEPGQPPEFRFEITNEARTFANDFTNRNRLSRYFVINPGASWESKRWENERFGSVGSYIFRHHGIRTVVTWAGKAEQEMANEIQYIDPEAFVIAPPTDLQQLAAVIEKAECFVGCDTGPLHIAGAVRTPCIGLYGTTRPQDSGAYPHSGATPHIAIQKWYQSGSCRKRRSAANDAMKDILAADVFMACNARIEKLVRAVG